MNDEARPILMSIGLAEALGLMDRMNGMDATTGIVRLTEAEILAFGVDRVEWGEPDSHGWYTPTLFSKPLAPLP